MERDPQQILYSERNAPKRKVVRSDGALYVLLLMLTFGMITLSHVLAKRFGVERLYLQIGLYSLLLACGYAVYRLRLIDYIYELTSDTLLVTQAVGSKQKRLAEIPLASIDEIGTYRETDAKQAVFANRGSRKNATVVLYHAEGEKRMLVINPTDMLKEKLAEAIDARE